MPVGIAQYLACLFLSVPIDPFVNLNGLVCVELGKTPLRTMSAALLSVDRRDGSARRPRIRRGVRPLRTNDARFPPGGVSFDIGLSDR